MSVSSAFFVPVTDVLLSAYFSAFLGFLATFGIKT